MSGGKDPFKYFRIEAREILEELGRGLLRMENEPSAAVAGQLLRLVHTLKGAARVVKQPKIAERAHTIEEALAPFRSGESLVDPDVVRRVFVLVDEITSDVNGLDPPAPDRATAAVHVQTVRADVAEVDSLLEGIAETSVQLRALRQTADATSRARHLADLLVDQLARGRTRDGALPARLRAVADDLRNTVVQMEQNLGGGIDVVVRELADVRVAAERLRLVPMQMVFSLLERAVHDAAQTVGRRVTFISRGGELGIDGHVFGPVQAALMQLVRNAVAHGIESPEERTRAGKPAHGRVEVSATRRGDRIVFVCADDGRGFDIEAVRRVAVRLGLPQIAADAMGEQALLELALRGGVTTSGTVTQVAGRGIGLDVVRETAATLGGDVRVENDRGRGARIELAVPLSLSSLDALLVVAGKTTAAIPLEVVRTTMRVAHDEISRTASGESIVSDGKVVPLMTLARHFAGRDGGAAAQVVVLEAGGSVAGVRVDHLVGIANIVVRPLPRIAKADGIVAGAALDAEGTPQLVLEPATVVAVALRGHSASRNEDERRTLPILVIDDSLTTRRLEQSILESAGYEVDVAASAEEGLAKARSKGYAVLLVDVEMPGMNGFELIEETRKDRTLRDVPCILVTSRSGPEDRKRGELAGARGFVAKGEFDQKELLALIRRLQG